MSVLIDSFVEHHPLGTLSPPSVRQIETYNSQNTLLKQHRRLARDRKKVNSVQIRELLRTQTEITHPNVWFLGNNCVGRSQKMTICLVYFYNSYNTTRLIISEREKINTARELMLVLPTQHVTFRTHCLLVY